MLGWAQKRRSALIVASCLVAGAMAAGLFWQRASSNLAHQDFRNSNFFFFWLSGRMVWTGQNPYDSTQWLAAHDAFGVSWRPNRIFPYPLALEFLLAPLGLLSLPAAYFVWQLAAQILMASSVWVLLGQWRPGPQRWLTYPLVVSLIFFGPVYLSLQIGSIGPITLITLVSVIMLFKRGASFPAGIVLSTTMLKPPQGVTLLMLGVAWLLARRDWRALGGLVAGGCILLSAGLLRDPLWLVKFFSASRTVMARSLGIQSNTFGFAYLACHENINCMWVAGSAASAVLLGAACYFLWHNQDWLTPLEAFSIIIPVAFVSTIYLWSYDQMPYVIPIVWAAGALVERTRSFAAAIGFVLLLVLFSLAALLALANTHEDMLSLGTTCIVIGMTLWLLRWRPTSAMRPRI
jgi:hypothetical protein